MWAVGGWFTFEKHTFFFFFYYLQELDNLGRRSPSVVSKARDVKASGYKKIKGKVNTVACQ